METMLVSVILPVYNVEQYLDKCIRSVVEQTYRNLEIILVNDGSKDSSPSICRQWEKKDQRVIVVDKANAGLGMARNTGLEYVHGKFVMFVDSDDFIEKNAVEKLVEGLQGSDTVFCGHNIFFDDNHIQPIPIKYGGQIFKDADIKNKILLEMMGAMPKDKNDIILPVSVWHGLYSMDIINANHIRFPSEREFISEDMVFDIDYFSCSKQVSFIEDCLYYYRLIYAGTCGKGLHIWHYGSIIINGYAKIGENCTLHGQNCIGNNGKSNEAPVIGNNVDIGAGASIIGNIKIADEIVIGAGAVVNKSFFRKGAILVGIPAHEIGE